MNNSVAVTFVSGLRMSCWFLGDGDRDSQSYSSQHDCAEWGWVQLNPWNDLGPLIWGELGEVVIGLQYTVGLDFCEFLHVLSPWDACLSGEILASMGTKPSLVLDKKLNTARLLTSLIPPRHSERELVESRKLSHIYPSVFVLLSAASTKTRRSNSMHSPALTQSGLSCCAWRLIQTDQYLHPCFCFASY